MNGTTIQKTKDYNKFDSVSGNRFVNQRHLANLTISVGKKNMLAQNPILVNEKFEVIDGQHRLEVARNNDLEVYYIVVPGARIEEVIQLNANSKEWVIKDYIASYATRGFKPYIWLQEFMDEYSLSFTQACLFVYGSDVKWVHTTIKKGAFEPTDEQKARALDRADILWDVRPFIKQVGQVPKAMVLALIDMEEKGHAKELVKAIKTQGKPFIPAKFRKDAFEQLMGFIK